MTRRTPAEWLALSRRPVYHLLGGPLDGATVTLRADQTDDGVPPERITTCGGAYVPSTNDPTTYVWAQTGG